MAVREELKAQEITGREHVEETRERAREFIKSVTPLELSLAEQALLAEGLTDHDLRDLCGVHLEVIGESIKKSQAALPQGHPVHTLMEEHRVILGQLETTATALAKLGTGDPGRDLELLGVINVAHHLRETEKHHQCEERALFTAMERHGITGPPRIMRAEHDLLRPKKRQLEAAAARADLDLVEEAGEYLVKELSEHIYKEDDILYPAAVDAIPPYAWVEIKEQCDAIGYCCFTPGQRQTAVGGPVFGPPSHPPGKIHFSIGT
ncbi:MAG: DUF438 domain-containing protein [Bacillota bacterium]